jgi:tRNA(Ile)-lysidine synthase TilS/MesJ
MKRVMTRLQEIERTILTSYRGKLWAPFVKALKEYKLLKENDHICVCISGGKDSMVLAKLFQELKRHSDFNFEVTYLVMNPGYKKETMDLIMSNLNTLGIEATIKETDIFKIANMQEKNPCYLCAKMRRGALYRLAKDLGCNKIALGHHYDDVIETTLMNMINAGSFQTMLPKLHSENFPGMELIRPLYLVREKDIIAWANRNELKFIQCACMFTEGVSCHAINSQRALTKKLIKDLENQNPNVAKNLFMAPANVNLNKILGYKKDNEYISYLDNYDKE